MSAISLGVSHAEIASQVLLGISPLLMAHHHHRLALEFGQPSNDGFVVGEEPVTVQLDELLHEPVDVIQGVGSFRVPGQLDALPGRQVTEDLLTQLLSALLQPLNLLGQFDVLAGAEIFHILNFLLQLNKRTFKIEDELVHSPLSYCRPVYRIALWAAEIPSLAEAAIPPDHPCL